MSLNDHARALRDRWIVIIALTAIGAALGYWATANQPVEFQSTSLIALGPRSTTGSSMSSTTQALYDRSVPSTLAQLSMSGSTAKAASGMTGIPADALDVRSTVANDANVVQVMVTGASPDATQRFAEALTRESMLRFDNMYPIFRTYNIGPAAPGESTAVSPTIGAVAGGLAGLLLGFLIALAMGRRHPALSVVERRRERATG